MSEVLQHREPPGRIEKTCYALLLFSLVLVASVAVRLATTVPLPSPDATATQPLTASVGARLRPPPASALRVVAADPFHPQRTAPAARYMLPEDRMVDIAPGPGSLREGLVRLLGTAVSGSGGGFVMCQVGSATPQMVRVGEVVGDLTLRSIARGEAEFTRSDGTTVTLSVPTARASSGQEPGR